MRSSILFCFRPRRNLRTRLEGAGAMCPHPWGTAGQACFRARLSQRFRRILDVPSCTSPRTRREDQSILGKTEESRFQFEEVLNSYSYNNRTRTARFSRRNTQSFFGHGSPCDVWGPGTLRNFLIVTPPTLRLRLALRYHRNKLSFRCQHEFASFISYANSIETPSLFRLFCSTST